eukprot:scaffold85006_cov63-Attheya_sp.AAC.5
MLLAVYRRRCNHAAVTLLLPLSRLMSLQPLRGVGVGLAGKGGMVGSGTKLSFGAIRSQWWCVVQQVGQRGWTE